MLSPRSSLLVPYNIHFVRQDRPHCLVIVTYLSRHCALLLKMIHMSSQALMSRRGRSSLLSLNESPQLTTRFGLIVVKATKTHERDRAHLMLSSLLFCNPNKDIKIRASSLPYGVKQDRFLRQKAVRDSPQTMSLVHLQH